MMIMTVTIIVTIITAIRITTTIITTTMSIIISMTIKMSNNRFILYIYTDKNNHTLLTDKNTDDI